MSQLQDNLNEILRQKNQVLIPSNVKSGVQYLGLTGTYTGDTIHDAFKVFSTIELMNVDTDKVLGDRAVVLGTDNIHPNENTTFSKLYLPETFTLDAKPDWLVQGVSQLMVLYNVDTDTEDDACMVSINAAADWPDIYMNFEFMSMGIQLEYSSNDGITWTANDTIQTGVKDLGGKYKFCDRTQSGTGEGWQNLMDLVFIQRNTFLGLYECKNVSDILTYQPLETQLSVITASDVTSGKTVFGANNTIVTGTMTMSQAEIDTATDTTENILGEPEIPDPVNEGPGEGGLGD